MFEVWNNAEKSWLFTVAQNGSIIVMIVLNDNGCNILSHPVANWSPVPAKK